MTAVVAQPMTGSMTGSMIGGVRPRARREVRVRMTATTAPDVRRAHPSAPSRRSVGAPAPSLRRGALPEQLRPRVLPAPKVAACAPAAPWRLTNRAMGLIVALVAILMLTSLVVVVAKAIQVTSPTSAYAVTR